MNTQLKSLPTRTFENSISALARVRNGAPSRIWRPINVASAGS